jgi:hypothetical protein
VHNSSAEKHGDKHTLPSAQVRHMHAAHALAREHGLNDVHFDRFLSHFREALKVGVEAQKVEKVANLLETRRNAVLNPLLRFCSLEDSSIE